jgi:NADH:ubiquinone oxidoreductase subunit 6 (subunit J)
LAELFVYVGGVLILILFAIMLVHRTGEGRTSLELRDKAAPLAAAALVSGMLFWVLASAVDELGSAVSPGDPSALAQLLLGPMLPQFEIAGALLLVALVAVVVMSGGDRR